MKPTARAFAILGLLALAPVLVFAAGRGEVIVLLAAVNVVLIAGSILVLTRDAPAVATT